MGGTIGKIKFQKHYELQDKLGSGTFASVYKAKRKIDGELVAIKIVKKRKLKPDELKLVGEEVAIMQQLHHPNCVRLFCVLDSRTKLHIVMELLTGGELFERIVESRFFSEQRAARVVQEVASALDYIHRQGVCHRDLKPENLLFLNKTPNSPIKVSDFGLATYTDRVLNVPCGTPAYAAPELLKLAGYGAKVDLWSLGVILYILLCGFPPFYHENLNQLYIQIKRGDYSFPSPYWDDISASVKHLVTMLLQVDPDQRYSAKEVLEHPWVAQLNQVSAHPFPEAYSQRIALTRAKARFRRGVKAVIAFNRFTRGLDEALDLEGQKKK